MTNLHETNAHGKVGGIRASLAEQLAAFRPAPPAAPAASVKPADSTGSLEPNTGTVAFAAAVKPAITGTARVKPNTGVAAKPTMGAKPELASTRAASSGAKPRHVEPDETMWAASKRDGSVVAIQLLSGESFSGVVRSFGLQLTTYCRGWLRGSVAEVCNRLGAKGNHHHHGDSYHGHGSHGGEQGHHGGGHGGAMIPAQVEHIPEVFRQLRGWVLHRKKVPYQPDGSPAKTNDPKTWSTFAQVVKAYEAGGYDGIGLCRMDDLVFVDLDGCFRTDPPSWARKIIEALTDYAYAEVSFSGDGGHLITRGKLPPGRRQWNDREQKHLGYALYDGSRLFTFTGKQLPGSTEPRDATPILAQLHAELFPRRNCNGITLPAHPAGGADSHIIERARRAKNGLKFSRLFDGDHSGYPSQSEADMALLRMLAFWTGRDATRMAALFRQSGLYRKKLGKGRLHQRNDREGNC